MGLRILAHIFDPIFVNEKVGVPVPCQPDDVTVKVLDPASKFFSIHERHDDRSLSF